MAQQLTAPSSNLTPDVFGGIWIELRQGKRALDEASAKYRAIRKRAEKLGVNLKGLALAEQFANLDQDEADQRLKDAVRYSRWVKLPLGAQPDLLASLGAEQMDAPGQKVSQELGMADAEAQGYAWGKRGENRDENPHETGTEAFGAWDTGWTLGQEAIAKEMAPGKRGRPRKGGGNGMAHLPKARERVSGSRLGV
jgi:hypothetical protein